MDTDKILYPDLTETIIGSAMKVLNTLKPGLNEKAYENGLAIELQQHIRCIEQQKRHNVLYEGQVVDTLVPDLIVDELVIVDPKVVEEFTSTHVAQMIGYLSITKLRLALLLNFKYADLRWRRVIR
jgi:GxxExxY protein